MDKRYKKVGRKYVEVEPSRFGDIDFIEFSFLVEACIPDKYSDFLDMDWRYIPGYENYIINSFGDVISLSRNIIRKNGNPQKIHPKYLKPCLDKNGYLFLRLSNLGSVKSIKVHQLVAMSFLNHTPCGMEKVIDHKDENKLNNYFENLQILSNRKNTSKSIDKSKTTSAFIGVYWNSAKKKWKSSIKINGKNKFLGYFDSEIEASRYYEDALIAIENKQDIKIKPTNFSSQYKGVTKTKKGKFRATFTFKGVFYSAGVFEKEQDAYNAYIKLFKTIKNEK
jgi:hypothetical protein